MELKAAYHKQVMYCLARIAQSNRRAKQWPDRAEYWRESAAGWRKSAAWWRDLAKKYAH